MKGYILIDIQDPRKNYEEGDIITDFHNESWKLLSYRPASTSGAEGKVFVRKMDPPNTEREFYARVFGCEVREVSTK